MIDALPLRLKPNQDLKLSLQKIAAIHQIQAGFILTAVGSLQQATLRFAGQDDSLCLSGRFEIVSLVGTLSTEGIHLHIALADTQGKTIGGHLQTGCIIYTTAEIVIGTIEGYRFQRTPDGETGYLELEINPL
ncbi:PPC domain-containing DNA-binding protein [Capilliphycus salinus ALCB114379]|uniref:PPC domain-containing DNA-binding protein n=1 Tax=Capilliphycus salinus TaxID=2768948 RepID=UPI0039A5A5F0